MNTRIKTMKVTFAPNNHPQPAGVVGFASWSNPDLQKAIRESFHESPREMIVEIIVVWSALEGRTDLDFMEVISA